VSEHRRRVTDLYLEIPTAGHNVAALVSTVSTVVRRRELVRVSVYDDDGCAALGGRSMRRSTCEIVGVRLRYLAIAA
jgi:hypothetical protein